MDKKYPFYFRTTVILFGLILAVYALSCLRTILVPVAFSLLLSILLNPVVNRFQKWKVPRIAAIIIAILIAFAVIGAIGYFLSRQIIGFSSQLPHLKQKFTQMAGEAQRQLNDHMGIDTVKQNQLVGEVKSDVKPLIGSTLNMMAGSMAIAILLPVYTFLLLFYKTLLLNFLYEIFAEEHSTEVYAVLTKTKKAIQSYMFGLVLEGLAVATLNSVALLLLGVPYAILLGVLGAMLNVLPFIGGILAALLPLVIATITKDGFQTQIWIIVAYCIIQFIDNHFLVPYIVSSRVKINALISIIIVLLGNAVWGIPGMFLAIPFTGVLKIIFDQLPEVKPWGKLLGDEVPVRHKGQIWNTVKREFQPRKKRQEKNSSRSSV